MTNKDKIKKFISEITLTTNWIFILWEEDSTIYHLPIQDEQIFEMTTQLTNKESFFIKIDKIKSKQYFSLDLFIQFYNLFSIKDTYYINILDFIRYKLDLKEQDYWNIEEDLDNQLKNNKWKYFTLLSKLIWTQNK